VTDINSRVSDTHGGVHAGSGHQYIYYVASLTDSRGRSPRKQAEDDLRWLAQRFVHPTGLGLARDILQSHRTVFLEARPGSGRIAAAQMLLWELRPGSSTIHQLWIQEKEEHGSPLDPGHIGDGDLAWLDLSATSGWSWNEIQSELSGLRHAVHERSAHLVVVLPDDHGDLQPEFGQYRARIDRPPVHDVLRHYLRMEGIPAPDRLPDIPFLHDDQPLREVPAFVQLIMEAREKVADSGDLADWCGIAYQAWSGREREVASDVARLTSGPQRALLLATAMLHGAHADCVYSASSALLSTMEHPSAQVPMLEQTALDHRFKEIGAETDDRGNVQFREIGYDPAVRAYFWTHMPELRDPIRRWVGSTVDAADLTEADRENLVVRFAEQCMPFRYQSMWVSFVEQCTERPTSRRMWAAALVLQRGLRDERSSHTFRRQIYGWSRSNLRSHLAEVIIAACRDEMFISHPDEALVRLHHVARREQGSLAFETVVALAGSDRRFLRQMLGRLVDRGPDAKRWPADIALFLELADPAALTDPGVRACPLIAESTVRRQLADGWKLVFTSCPHQGWSPMAEKWLRSAAEAMRDRRPLLDVLIEGSEQRTDVVARLYVMTRRREFPDDLSELVLLKTSPVEMS
jgi:hypothetical protein